jgi:hypothetical protein
MVAPAALLSAQDTLAVERWSDGTAYTLPRKRIELGLLQLSGYGLTDKVEIMAHPVMLWFYPQVKVKAAWTTFSGWQLASEHELSYPTGFYTLVSRKGIGGLISPEFHYPQMFSFYNAALVSCRPFNRAIFTAKAGVVFAVRSGPIDHRTTLDMPVIYPRMAPVYHSPEFDLGVDFRGRFSRIFGWICSGEGFILTTSSQNFFFEHKGALAYYSKKSHYMLQAGYKLCYGDYPFGTEWHLLPLVDMGFGIGKK